MDMSHVTDRGSGAHGGPGAPPACALAAAARRATLCVWDETMGPCAHVKTIEWPNVKLTS